METFSYGFCLLFFSADFFFSRSSVIFSFQLELAALPLGPQAQCPSVEDVLGALASSLGTHRAWKARPCGPELMTRPAVGAVQWPRGRGQGGDPRERSDGVQAVNSVRGPLLSQLGFWPRVPRVARRGDLGCLWFTNCFTNISSLWEVPYTPHPLQLSRAAQRPSQTCLCLQLFRKFSQRGGSEPLPPLPVFYF